MCKIYVRLYWFFILFLLSVGGKILFISIFIVLVIVLFVFGGVNVVFNLKDIFYLILGFKMFFRLFVWLFFCCMVIGRK